MSIAAQVNNVAHGPLVLYRTNNADAKMNALKATVFKVNFQVKQKNKYAYFTICIYSMGFSLFKTVW